MKNNYFLSIIWGYSRNMYQFSQEENYHLQALKVAKGLGYKTAVLIRQAPGDIEGDPNFDPETLVINYKNAFHFIWQIFRFCRSLVYVNSYEWQSFVVPFVCRRAIFMGHTHPVRQSRSKQLIQDFVFKFFYRIRLTNEQEKTYLLRRGLPAAKLFVVPLAIAPKYFYKIEGVARRDIVYFGNVTAKKNLPTILRALLDVRQKFPEVKLHIVGKISDDTFWPAVRALGLEAAIQAYGFLPLTDLAKTLNSFLIYCNSSFDEGQCVAVFDAALCGLALCLPSIMSFSGVFKGMALFHSVNDHNKLTENMLYYLQHPEAAEHHNRKLREYILEGYSGARVELGLRQLFTIS